MDAFLTAQFLTSDFKQEQNTLQMDEIKKNAVLLLLR